tara:strand:+ start:1158 stop:1496 length:339 start_codon:yes stop_codon:yes gene_type:complete
MKEMIKDSTLVLLLISAVYISVMGIAQVNNAHDKQTTDWTNSTQGVQDTMTEAELMLSKEPDCIYYDTLHWQQEEDSINAYMRHWYEVLDTNSDGDIDGEYINDSIIEWLEE